MQTTKFLVVLGAAAALLAPLSAVAAPDSEAQAKLREAMRLKMEELNAQSTPAPAPVAPAPKPKPAVVEEIKPIERPPTVVVPVPVEPTTVVVAPAAIKAPKVEKSDARFSEVPDEAQEAKNAQLLESLRAKVAAEKVSAPVVANPTTPAKPASVFSAVPAEVAPITANIEAPASPLSGTKQDRLAELLRRYKADEITPQDYHKQRAQIIAE